MQDIENIFICPKSLLLPLRSQFLLPISATADLLFIPWDLLECHIRGMRQHVLFRVWLSPLCLRFIPGVTVACFFSPVNSIRLHGYLTTYSSIHLGYFHFWLITNIMATNIHVQVFMWIYILISLRKIPESEVTGSYDSVPVMVNYTQTLFQSHYTIVYSRQKCIKIPIPSLLPVFIILTSLGKA